ncbi:hypothetical protein DFQ27_000698 [Actinomortierella ambigua]|uniref:AB hydrolase-1 domain-containing protein n=1 Tax=Actinomortierella ambigua TaxID=1343610 RepID=A0A9P6QGZ0_9FUNG|nr:hypothetical protein DFQ27_000698 [Actinomortierella ambigua]
MFSIDPSSFNHKYTTLGGFKYHYIEEGNSEGPTLLLIHGFPDFWFGWRYQIRHLAAQGYHVLAIDNLGGGETDVPKCVGLDVQPYRSKNLAKNIVELLDQLHVDKAIIVGHDCVGNPHRPPTAEYFGTEEYVKENPAFIYIPFLETPESDDFYYSNVAQMMSRMFGKNTSDDKIGTGDGTTDKDVQFYIDTFTKSTFHGLLNYYRSFRLNHEDELPFVGKPYVVPSLLMVIQNDVILNPAYVAGIPQTCFVDLEQVEIKQGTHFVLTENPEGVNAELDKYLAKLVARRIIKSPKV